MGYTAGQLTKIFSEYKDPNESVFISYIDKSDVVERLEGMEIEDAEGNLIDAESFVTDDFLNTVFTQLSDDDSLWERFADSYTDILYDSAVKLIQEQAIDKQLWDTETEKQ